jgi:hypothetical protein
MEYGPGLASLRIIPLDTVQPANLAEIMKIVEGVKQINASRPRHQPRHPIN